MPKIFLSYRRDDSAGYAGRVAERLSDTFGHINVFRDVDDIKPGVDFTEAIGRAVGNCDVLLALIGPRWLTEADTTGARRLDHPQDFVRIEISSALERKVRVIPVLVQKAEMPAEELLPEPLKPFALHQAIELSDTRWDYDVGQLIAALGGKAVAKPRWPAAITVLTIAIALAGGGWAYFSQIDKPIKKQPPAIASTKQAATDKSIEKPAPLVEAKKAADVRGKWIGSWTGPQGREFHIQFNFESQDDRLMGSVNYPTGDGAIYDGKIDGDRLLFVTRHTPQFESQEATISFVGKIVGDQIELVMQRPNGAQRLIAHRKPAR
jgi:hypothetical protein